MPEFDPIILVHGGTTTRDNQMLDEKLEGVKDACKEGYKILIAGGTAADAVEAAIKCMENNEAFNAGLGSNLNINGDVEMDALLMKGDYSAGAVAAAKDIAHPITVARKVLENTPHVLLAGCGVNKFVREQGMMRLKPGQLVTDHATQLLEECKEKKECPSDYVRNGEDVGTVGAVALDKCGHLATGTSTGGCTGKMVGRVSPAAIIGNGAIADDNVGAVSTSGHGESIMKACLASCILKAMECGKSACKASCGCIQHLTKKFSNTAGAISLSKKGEIGISFSSQCMAWAYQKGEEMHFGIQRGQDDVEVVDSADNDCACGD